MKRKSVFFAIAVLAIMALVLVGCDMGGNGGGGGIFSGGLVLEAGYAWIENNDTTALIFNRGNTYQTYTWSDGIWSLLNDGYYLVINNNLSCENGDKTFTYTFSIIGNTLSLSIDGLYTTYTKEEFTPPAK